MKTMQEMRAEVIRTLEEGAIDGPDGYDVNKIVDELYSAAGTSWDIGNVSPGAFWGIVYKNSIPAQQAVEPTAEELVSELIHFYAQRRNGRHSVPGSEVLIHAYQMVHGGSEEDADAAVGERLEDIYANAA